MYFDTVGCCHLRALPRSADNDTITSHGRHPDALHPFLKTFTQQHTVNGTAPRTGQVFRNPELAATLRLVQSGGCQEFYNGSIAARIAAFAAEVGIPLQADDFASHHGEWVDPVNASYRGYEVHELPPNPQGIATLQMLNMLETFNMTQFGHNSANYLHASIEAKKLAFADRAKYYADPDFADVPVEG